MTEVTVIFNVETVSPWVFAHRIAQVGWESGALNKNETVLMPPLVGGPRRILRYEDLHLDGGNF